MAFSAWGQGLWLTLFFFSSRRRHTRCSRDWSSDVCSSDLAMGVIFTENLTNDHRGLAEFRARTESELAHGIEDAAVHGLETVTCIRKRARHNEIGRASCRERG